jgi:PAS domain S-box-containing protein
MKIKPVMALLLVFLLGAFSLFVYLYQDHAVREAGRQIEDHAQIVSSSLWTFEKTSPSAYLTLAAASNDYHQITVLDHNGGTFLDIEGPPLQGFDAFLAATNLIRHYPLTSDIEYQGKIIGEIRATWRSKTVYVYLYVIICAGLLLVAAWLFIKLLEANRNLNVRVRQRTQELELEIVYRQKAEEEQKAYAQRLATHINYTPLGVIEWDPGFKVRSWNQAAERIFGYTAAEALGRSAQDLIVPHTDKDHVDLIWRNLITGTGGIRSTNRNVTKTGETRICDWYNTPLNDSDSRLIGVASLVQDITERKRIENDLRLTQFCFDKASMGILLIGTGGRITEVNEQACRDLGYSREEIRGLAVTDIDPAIKQTEWEQRLTDLRNLRHTAIESAYHRKDGTVFSVETIYNYIRFEDEELVIAFFRDITDRKQSELELNRLRNYLANIIDSMPSVLVGLDREGRITQWNRQAENETGLKADAALGRKYTEVFPRLASEMAKVEAAMRQRQSQRDTKTSRLVKGELRYEDVTVYPLVTNGAEGVVIRLDDVTDRVRLEEMMVQSEKMLSVGGLAAGMAHEINNPLAGMMQTAHVMADRLSRDIPANLEAAESAGATMAAVRAFMEARGIPRMLNTIIQSGHRAADIVENMLSFARKNDTTATRHNLADLLDRTLELAETDYDLKKKYDFKQIEIIREFAPGVPLVPCQGQKIQQVFLNILRNGAEAMFAPSTSPERSQGQTPRFVLRVSAEERMVRVEIEDNGPGMDEDIRRRVLEPFFTTKPPGMGTGLGLSVSYFIITENHNGEMTVSSAPGQGSKFVIWLPFESSAHE